MKYETLRTLLVLVHVLASPAIATGQEDHDAKGEEREANPLRLDARERESLGVRTAPVEQRRLTGQLQAPGEVVLNAYRSARVAPRIAAQIVRRHARLGDAVEAGTRLVTLSSVEMADAQGELLVADQEWRRVRELGRQVVSERRYVEAEVTRQRAYAQVLAYGMTAPQVDALLAGADASRANGEFELLAPQPGTVVFDDFIVGSLAEAGRVLFEITDESVLWVEASLAAGDAQSMAVGAPVRVRIESGIWLDGAIVQLHHRLDEATRRVAVRIEVANDHEHLHPGQFVDVELGAGSGPAVTAVPDRAVVLVDGRPSVFALASDEFEPVAVETGASAGAWTELRSGVAPGTEVAVEGAFALKSLLLKSRLGEGHGH